MECILLSTPGRWGDASVQEEVKQVERFFEQGLELFHLRKPMYSVAELKKWLSCLDPKYLSRVSLHSFHDLVYQYPVGGVHTSERHRKRCLVSRQQDDFLLEQFPKLRLSSSFHDLSDLRFAPKIYDYIFISPVFDSISKPHYKACFSRKELTSTVTQARNKVVALGGMSADKVSDAAQMGFDGVGFLGAVWNAADPERAFEECLEASSANTVQEAIAL